MAVGNTASGYHYPDDWPAPCAAVRPNCPPMAPLSMRQESHHPGAPASSASARSRRDSRGDEGSCRPCGLQLEPSVELAVAAAAWQLPARLCSRLRTDSRPRCRRPRMISSTRRTTPTGLDQPLRVGEVASDPPAISTWHRRGLRHLIDGVPLSACWPRRTVSRAFGQFLPRPPIHRRKPLRRRAPALPADCVRSQYAFLGVTPLQFALAELLASNPNSG